jgi:aldehyde:ferredoxin oxidoreductase
MSIPGYAGRILNIDLGSRSTEVRPLDESWIDKYLGGWGINYRLAYDLIEPGADPLSAGNPIILGIGPLAGTLYPGSCKVLATSKMPLTASVDGKHFVATSTGGSNTFLLMFKAAGYDHIVIQGRAEKPTYLKIDNDEVEFCDGRDLWGQKDVYKTTEILNKRHPGFGIATIGKAGENQVRFAMAYLDKHWHLGKSGFGAVMGSKNLKAVIVRGNKGVRVADPDRFMKVVDYLRAKADDNPTVKQIRRIGFHQLWNPIWVHNFYQSEVWTKEEWSKYYGIESAEKVIKSNKSCSSCCIGCKTVCSVKDGEYQGQELHTMHYSSIAPIGDRFQLKDPGGPLRFGEYCNKYGMDVLNSTSMVDWITRLYVDKEITKEQSDGIELSRSIDTYLLLLEKMTNREGALGNAMADGWFTLSNFVGKDATKDYIYGNQIAKGQECIYPARAAKLDPMRISMLMTNPRGGGSPHGHSATVVPLRPLKHVKADAANTGMSEEELEQIFSEDDFDHPRLTRHIEDAYAVYNALGVCSTVATFGWTNVKILSEAYTALTGIAITPQELKKDGERITNLYKMLNVREGFRREHDLPPEAVFVPIQTPEGEQGLEDYYRNKKYSMEDCERLLDAYYKSRGWDVTTGIPTKKKLRELGLEIFSSENW